MSFPTEKAKQEGIDVAKERKLLADLYIELAKYMMQYEKNEKVTLEILQDAAKFTSNEESM